MRPNVSLRTDATRLRRSKRNAKTSRRLHVESLERRDLLATMTPDHTVFAPHNASPAATSSSSGYTPAQIRTAYGFSNSTTVNGSGQTIAIIDAFNDPNIASDLAAFDAAYGIAAPPSFKIVNQNGGTSLPKTDPSQGWEGETALDVEWAHAIAPGANIVLVEANSDSDTDLFAAVNYARQLAGVSVISMSWGSDDNASFAANDQSLSNKYLVTPSGHQGITFVASSGDDGEASFPAESPNVLAVGGTDLYLASNGTITNETAWTPTTSGGQVWSGGGGVSTEFPGRHVPDVSYNAGVAFAVYDTFGPDHGWVSVGGTSAGAPQWAALIAIADQGRVASGLTTLDSSHTLAAIYAAPSSDFHDITSGSTQFQSTAVGYDLATGIGSPVANALIPYLVAYAGSGSTSGTTSGGTSTGGSGSSGSGSGGTTGTTGTAPTAPANFTAQSLSTTQVKLSWSTSAGATSYQVYELENGQPVLLGSLSAGTSGATVSGLSAGTTYSFEVAAKNSSGSTATNWVQVTTQAAAATTAVAAPTGVQATATSSTVAQVTWNASAGATGYFVYEMVGSHAQQVANLGAGATSVSVSGQTPGATESFYVVAYNSSSNAASSLVSVVMPAAVALVAPTNLVATATSSTTATLAWNASSGATGYALYYSSGGRTYFLGTVDSGTTSVSLSGLRAGATYSFYVAAYNATSIAASNWVSLTAPTTTTAAHAAAFSATTRAWWMD